MGYGNKFGQFREESYEPHHQRLTPEQLARDAIDSFHTVRSASGGNTGDDHFFLNNIRGMIEKLPPSDFKSLASEFVQRAQRIVEAETSEELADTGDYIGRHQHPHTEQMMTTIDDFHRAADALLSNPAHHQRGPESTSDTHDGGSHGQGRNHNAEDQPHDATTAQPQAMRMSSQIDVDNRLEGSELTRGAAHSRSNYTDASEKPTNPQSFDASTSTAENGSDSSPSSATTTPTDSGSSATPTAPDATTSNDTIQNSAVETQNVVDDTTSQQGAYVANADTPTSTEHIGGPRDSDQGAARGYEFATMRLENQSPDDDQFTQTGLTNNPGDGEATRPEPSAADGMPAEDNGVGFVSAERSSTRPESTDDGREFGTLTDERDDTEEQQALATAEPNRHNEDANQNIELSWSNEDQDDLYEMLSTGSG